MKKRFFFFSGVLLLAGALTASAQENRQDQKDSLKRGISLRTNLFWDGAAEPNIGIEFPLGKHVSLGVSGGIKTWPRWLFWDNDNVNDTRHWRNFAVVPELRVYLDEIYNGFFLGADVVYTHYNVGNVKFPLGLYPETQDSRVQGDFLGVGVLAGYSWWLGRHWRIEVEAGVAAGWAGYGRYGCEHCGTKLEDVNKVGVVPKLGLNLAWNPVPRKEKAKKSDCDVYLPLKEIPPLPAPPDPVEDPGDFRPQLPQVEPHRGAVDSVKTPILLHISDYKPYTPDQVLRKKRGMLKAFFPAGKKDMQLSFREAGYVRDNRPMLDSVVNITRMILADDISQVEKIQIVGFASIEGSESVNGKLARGRAESLRDYVQARVQARPGVFVVENGQEGWAEFEDLVKDSDLSPADKARVLDIVGTPTLDARENRRKEQALKADARLWTLIKGKILPQQRNSGYIRVYVSWVPDRSAEEINQAIHTINSGSVNEGVTALLSMGDERAKSTLELLDRQLAAHQEAMRRYETWRASQERWEAQAAKRQEAEDWNAMARAHNAAVQDCLEGK